MRLSTNDWQLPCLGLVASVKPKSAERVLARCGKCNSLHELVFAELLRSFNTQSRYVDTWMCPSCFRNIPRFKSDKAAKASETLAKSKPERSKISKELWDDSAYRAKCEANARKLSESVEFSEKVSNSIKAKFATDAEYVKKIKLARSSYHCDTVHPRCMSCDEFVDRASVVHDHKYDYSDVSYINSKTKVLVNCPNHGGFWVRPSHHIHYANGCPVCDREKTTSTAELEIYEYVMSNYVGKVEQWDRTQLDGLEIDVWVPDLKFGIEYHGAYFHSHSTVESSYDRKYHALKANRAAMNGISLLQFVDLDYHQKPLVAKSMIDHKLGLSNKLYARCCELDLVDNGSAKVFFDHNHYHSGVHSDVAFGLYYDGNLVSVLSLAKRHYGYEISRYANMIGTTVVGGFSRLLTAFLRYHRCKITSYVDRSFTTNDNCYSKFPMAYAGITRPGYRYFKSNKLYNRRSFQKHLLSAKLEVFDDKLTEAENMFNNGYRRLWDAGNLRYVLENTQ